MPVASRPGAAALGVALAALAGTVAGALFAFAPLACPPHGRGRRRPRQHVPTGSNVEPSPRPGLPWAAATAAGALCLVLAGCALVPPRLHPPPSGSESAARLAPGPHAVRAADVVLVDAGRGRTLPATIWWPADAPAPTPLVVQAHGFLATRSAGTYLARDLASRGYTVIAATHPTTTLCARGGAKLQDVVRQPGDVRFLIDRALAGDLGVAGLPPIDPARTAVVGHSLGGLTATLAAFHPRLRDPRIAAAVSIAGPMAMLRPGLFRAAQVPFLMIAGTADVIVDYRRNALVTLSRVPGATLVSIVGASHSGFHHAAAALPRIAGNPDTFGCWMLARNLHLDAAVADVRPRLRTGDEVDLDGGVRRPCDEPPPRRVMAPRRQQMITILAVAAFLESRFAPDPAARGRARHYLTVGLPREIVEARVATATVPPPRAVGQRGISM